MLIGLKSLGVSILSRLRLKPCCCAETPSGESCDSSSVLSLTDIADLAACTVLGPMTKFRRGRDNSQYLVVAELVGWRESTSEHVDFNGE